MRDLGTPAWRGARRGLLTLTFIYGYGSGPTTCHDWPCFSRSRWVFNMGCGSELAPDDPLAGIELIGDDLTDVLLHDAFCEQVARFKDGDDDALRFRPSASDGLGPLYIRAACAGCYRRRLARPGRGPEDGARRGRRRRRRRRIRGASLRPHVAALRRRGAMTLSQPESEATIKVSKRLGPPVFGRGYMEAVADAEIERVAPSRPRAATPSAAHQPRGVPLEEERDESFSAFVEGDENPIGRLGSGRRHARRLHGRRLPGRHGHHLAAPAGRAAELRRAHGRRQAGRGRGPRHGERRRRLHALARDPEARLPRRRAARPGALRRGRPRRLPCPLKPEDARADYPIAQLADIDAPVYTDSPARPRPRSRRWLADESASSVAWRTAPLIGVRHSTAYLHDGRARTIEQAICSTTAPARRPRLRSPRSARSPTRIAGRHRLRALA